MAISTVPLASTRGIGRLATAILVTAVMLGVSLITLWGSSASAAVPFTFFYTSISVLFVSSLCGGESSLLPLFGVGAASLAPATLAHVALTFPRRRDALIESSILPNSLYAMSAVLGLIGIVNFHRSPAVWILTDRVAIVLTSAAWFLLVVKCILAMMESNSPLDRARAKVLLLGAICVPAIPLALRALLGDDLPGGHLSALMISVALIPLPIGYAIASYRLFDLGVTMRRAVAYILFVATSALGACIFAVAVAFSLGLPVPLGDPALLFAVAFLGFLVAEPLRVRLWGAIDGWISPWFRRLREMAEEHSRSVAGLRDPDDCARILCESVSAALESSGVSIFLNSDGEWRLAHAVGSRAAMTLDAALVRIASSRGAVFTLDEDDGGSEAIDSSVDQGDRIDLVVSLRSGAETVGMMLVAPSSRRLPYSSYHQDFVRSIARHSAVAIHNGYLARELVSAERFATLGRIEAGLLHDLGKPLGVLERLASRLPLRIDDSERLRRDSRAIADLASGVRSSIREILSSRRQSWAPDSRLGITTEEGIHEATDLVSRVHGSGRVSVRVPPHLSSDPMFGERFVRVLTNVLDNALLASGPDGVVALNVSEASGSLRIEVSDTGIGMSESVVRRAFEPFFTTRNPGDGTGLGLFICKNLVEELGGSIRLTSSEGAGTRVTIRFPLDDATAHEIDTL